MSAILNDVSKTQLFIEVVLMNCVARRVNMSHRGAIFQRSSLSTLAISEKFENTYYDTSFGLNVTKK